MTPNLASCKATCLSTMYCVSCIDTGLWLEMWLLRQEIFEHAEAAGAQCAPRGGTHPTPWAANARHCCRHGSVWCPNCSLLRIPAGRWYHCSQHNCHRLLQRHLLLLLPLTAYVWHLPHDWCQVTSDICIKRAYICMRVVHTHYIYDIYIYACVILY